MCSVIVDAVRDSFVVPPAIPEQHASHMCCGIFARPMKAS